MHPIVFLPVFIAVIIAISNYKASREGMVQIAGKNAAGKVTVKNADDSME